RAVAAAGGAGGRRAGRDGFAAGGVRRRRRARRLRPDRAVEHVQQAVTTVVFCAVILVALLARRGGRSRVEAADESSWSLTGGARPLPAAVAALPEVRLGRAALAAAVAGVAGLVPLVASPSQTNRVSATLILGMAALSLVVLTGWSGSVSLGQAGLVGVGGVVAANLVAKANLDLFLTVAVSALAGAAV